MNKDLFISTMNKLEELNKEQEEFYNILHKMDNEFGGCYIHNKTISMVEDLLKNLMNDKYDYIGYYMWELNFGKDYTDGIITEADGTIIKLANAEDLYNLITSNQK